MMTETCSALKINGNRCSRTASVVEVGKALCDTHSAEGMRKNQRNGGAPKRSPWRHPDSDRVPIRKYGDPGYRFAYVPTPEEIAALASVKDGEA